jgi:hypothetical protein
LFNPPLPPSGVLFGTARESLYMVETRESVQPHLWKRTL